MAPKVVPGLVTPKTDTGTSTGGYVPSTGGAVAQKIRVPSYSSSYSSPELGTTQVITNAVYQNLMGRNATAAEIEKYHQAYTQYARSHPNSSSTSTSEVDPTTGLVTANKSVSTSGNLSEQDFISNLLGKNAEAKDYTAATVYMDAVERAISGARGVY